VYVVRPRLVERFARFALVASLNVGRHLETIERFGKNSRAGSLANPAWSTKQVGLRQMPVFDGIFERIGHKTLTNNRIKRCRSVFSRRYDKITGLHIGFVGFHIDSIYVSRY